MNPRIVLTVIACCLCLVLLASCAAEPAPIILETPAASATAYVTPAPPVPATPTARPTRSPAATSTAAPVAAQSPISNPQSPSAATGPKININTADEAALASLPRIGPSTARHIIDYRAAHGPFRKIEDLSDVPGIGDATFNAVKDLITVGD